MTNYIQKIKKEFPTGTRIKLIHMNNDLFPVPDNTLGTVDFVDDAGQIHMKWDNGSTLALIYEVDHFIKVDPTCPICGKEYSDYPAISRADNKTKICPNCGRNEALEAFNKYYNLTN